MHLGLERDRVRDHAGQHRKRHCSLFHGEPGSCGNPYRRQHCCCPCPYPVGQGVPDAPLRLPGHDNSPGHRGWMQLSVCPEPRQLRVRSNRGEPTCITFLCPGLKGHRLPYRQDNYKDCPGLHTGRDKERYHRKDLCLLRAGPGLCGGEVPEVAIRQVCRLKPQAGNPDEGYRRGYGHRQQLRGRPDEGGAWYRDWV